MNIRFLLNNFDFKKDLGDQAKFLLKKHQYLKALLYVAVWLMLSGGDFLFGQSAYTTSQMLQPLNDGGGSARSAAMGSALVGVADDPTALLANPAGLGGLAQGEAGFNHDSWLLGTFQESLCTGIPLGSLGGIGARVSFLEFGTSEGFNSVGSPSGAGNPDEWGLSLGWGKSLSPAFSIGLALNGIQQSSVRGSADSAGGSAGLLFAPDVHWRFGASWVNLGGNQDLPLMTSALEAGLSYQSSFGRDHHLLLAVAGLYEPQGMDGVQAGAEYSFQSGYFLRVGYQDYFQAALSGFQGFTTGAGIRWRDLQLDYAFLDYGGLGTSQRVSLSYFFPAPQKAQAKPPPEQPAATFRPNDGSSKNQRVLTLQFDVPPDDLVAQGKALDAQGQTAQAMNVYEDELKQNDKDAAAWYYLGSDYAKLGQKDYAVRCLEKALALDPSNKALADWLGQYKGSKP